MSGGGGGDGYGDVYGSRDLMELIACMQQPLNRYSTILSSDISQFCHPIYHNSDTSTTFSGGDVGVGPLQRTGGHRRLL